MKVCVFIVFSLIFLGSFAHGGKEELLEGDYVLSGVHHLKKTGYVSANLDTETMPEVLRQKATEVAFPLSCEDRNAIAFLKARFDAEENCAGLAGPQINYSKRVIVFALPETLKQEASRKHITTTIEPTIWINPSYEPVGDERQLDFEGCFSVDTYLAFVERYMTINYTAYDLEGNKIVGTADGFLARIIQHEVDHLNGVLFTDHVADKAGLFTRDALKEKVGQARDADS